MVLVEVPRWRHAVINFHTHCLSKGLVILDTPGLNAPIGAEPELTLVATPGMHMRCYLFLLQTQGGDAV